MLRLEACHLLEVWVFPEFHSRAHSSKVTGARCVSVWCSGSSRKPAVWLKEKAVLRTRHMLLATDKWCLTAPLAPCPPCSPVECALSGLHSQPAGALTQREREGWSLLSRPHSRPILIPEAPHLPVEALLFFFLPLMVSFLQGLCSECKAEDQVCKNSHRALVETQHPALMLEVHQRRRRNGPTVRRSEWPGPALSTHMAVYKLDLQTVVSHYVGTGQQAQLLQKSSQCS